MSFRNAAAEALEPRALLTATPSLVNYLTSEHVDINIGRSGSDWWIGPQNSDESPALQYANDEVVLYAGAPSELARPTSSAFDFVGIGPGETFYMLPQNQDTDLLYLGVAAYGLDNSVDRYNPITESKGRSSGNARWTTFSLVDLRHEAPDGTSSNGQFSMWQSGNTEPVAFISSYDDGVDNPNTDGLDLTDGISSDDAMWIIAGGHTHFNFGFTEPGRYEVDVKLSAYFGDDGAGNSSTPNLDGFDESDTLTLYFSIMNAGEVQFDSSTYSVDEGAGTASVDVVRTGGSDGRLIVNYSASNGTAAGDEDYTATTGELEFLDGDTRKTITVPILEDLVVEGNETVNLDLSVTPFDDQNPMSDYSQLNEYVKYRDLGDLEDPNGFLGEISSALLTIVDNDIPPTISNVDDQTTAEDTPTGAIAFTIGDNATPVDSLVVTASSSNPTLVPPSNIAIGGSGESRTVTITPAANLFGVTTITLTVSDADGFTATDTFDLTVTSVNDAPTMTGIVDQSIESNSATDSLLFTIGDVETAASELTVTASSSNSTLVPDGNISISGTGADRSVTVTPTADEIGTATVTLVVTDENGETTNSSFVLTVNPNSPPTISNVADQTTDEDIATAAIEFVIGDISTDANELVVTATSSNAALVPDANISLNGSGSDRTITLTPVANQSGTTAVTLTVTDEAGLFATKTFQLTVTAVNDLPVVSEITDRFAVADTPTDAIAFTISDIETDSANLNVSATSSNMTVVPNANITFTGSGADRAVTIQPVTNQIGATTITVTVTDEGGSQTSEEFELTVVEVPVATNDAYSVTTNNAIRGNVAFNDSVSQILNFSISESTSPVHGALQLNSDGTFTYTPDDTFDGTDSFGYLLSDGVSETVATVSITAALAPSGEVLSEGHADFLINYHEDHWDFSVLGEDGHEHDHDDEHDDDHDDDEHSEDEHDDEHEHEHGEGYHLDEVIIHGGAQSGVERPENANFDFTGALAGETLYILPQTSIPELPFLGVNSEQIETDTFEDNEFSLHLLSIDGPGEFSLWQSGLDSPDVFLASSDGVSNSDSVVLTEGSHAHYNWGFSSPGTYRVTLQTSGVLQDGVTPVASDPVTMTFMIGDVTIAMGDDYTVSGTNSVQGNVLFNDLVAEGETGSVSEATSPAHGALQLNSDGTFTYTPDDTFDGTDSFSYLLTDGVSETVATVSITAEETGTASIRKFHDLNGDGERTSDEPWLNGWTIRLLDAAGNVVAETVTTDVDVNNDQQIDPETESGWALFDVAPGTYTVEEVSQDGWAQTTPVSTEMETASQLDESYNFSLTVNDFENWGGLSERWIFSDDGWFYITPDGNLFQWDGSTADNLSGNLVGTLSAAYHEDLSLMVDAPEITMANVTVTLGQTSDVVYFGSRDIDAFGSVPVRKFHDLNGDGERTSDEPWLNGWTIRLLDAAGNVVAETVTTDVDVNNDQQIDPETESGWALFDVAPGTYTVEEVSQDGWTQTTPVSTEIETASQLDESYNFSLTLSDFENWGGLGERWIFSDDGWFYITPDGNLFQWDGSTADNLSGNLVETLSAAYHDNLSLMVDATEAAVVKVTARSRQASPPVYFGSQNTASDSFGSLLDQTMQQLANSGVDGLL